MERDLTAIEAWQKETAREVFNLVKKSMEINPPIDIDIALIMRTKYALWKITGLDESLCGNIAAEVIAEEGGQK